MDITLADGRTIAMQSLEQQLTYAGVLCGRFGAKDNDARIAEFVTIARERMAGLSRVIVIAPLREKLPHRANSSAPEAERLPRVASLAEFRSNSPANDMGETYSSAAFVWFQPDFGLPDERAVQGLREVNWPSVATDWTP